MTRRDLLALAALWTEAQAAAQQHSHATAGGSEAKPYRFVFFTPDETQTLRRLAARIVPADDRSGGAAAARVEEYIDFVLSRASRELQRRWRDSLARWKRLTAQIRHDDDLDAFLTPLAEREFSPKTPDEEFFVLFKSAVVDAFYTSEEGINRELRYQGLGFVREFPGCTHETHATPAGYRPALRSRG